MLKLVERQVRTWSWFQSSVLDVYSPSLSCLQGNQEEKVLNAKISNLIGRRLHDFDIMGAEVRVGVREEQCRERERERQRRDREKMGEKGGSCF